MSETVESIARFLNTTTLASWEPAKVIDIVVFRTRKESYERVVRKMRFKRSGTKIQDSVSMQTTADFSVACQPREATISDQPAAEGCPTSPTPALSYLDPLSASKFLGLIRLFESVPDCIRNIRIQYQEDFGQALTVYKRSLAMRLEGERRAHDEDSRRDCIRDEISMIRNEVECLSMTEADVESQCACLQYKLGCLEARQIADRDGLDFLMGRIFDEKKRADELRLSVGHTQTDQKVPEEVFSTAISPCPVRAAYMKRIMERRRKLRGAESRLRELKREEVEEALLARLLTLL